MVTVKLQIFWYTAVGKSHQIAISMARASLFFLRSLSPVAYPYSLCPTNTRVNGIKPAAAYATQNRERNTG
jgi:hypothetical protein